MSAHLYTCIIRQGREQWVGYGVSENIDSRYSKHKHNLGRAGFRLTKWRTYELPDISIARTIENKVKRNTRSIDLRVDGFRIEAAPIAQAGWIADIIEDGLMEYQDDFCYEQHKNKEQERARRTKEARDARDSAREEMQNRRLEVREWFTSLSATDQGLLAKFYRQEIPHLRSKTDDWVVIDRTVVYERDLDLAHLKEKLVWCIADEARRVKIRENYWNNVAINNQVKQ